MGLSLIDVVKEYSRQKATNDDRYAKQYAYCFKLRTKAGSGGTGATGASWFPLPLAPNSYTIEWDFANQLTPTQNDAVIAERGGVIIGRLSLSAFMGLTLRKSRDTSLSGKSARMFGTLGQYGGSLQELSGQMHAWRLLLRCFGAYSELVKDPQTSPYTWMEFHSLKDRFHVVIEPQKVSLSRSSDNVTKIGYSLQIEASIVDDAKPPTALEQAAVTDNQSILDDILDGIAAARNAVAQVQATVQALQSVADVVSRQIESFISIISDCNRVIDATTDFLDGSKSFVNIPTNFMNQLNDSITSSKALAEASTNFSSGSLTKAKAAYYEQWCNLEDEMDSLTTAIKGYMKEDYDAVATMHNALSDHISKMTDQEIIAAQAITITGEDAGGTLSIDQAFGGAYSPGQYEKMAAKTQTPSMKIGQYNGVKEIAIKSGDSVQSLALNHLGSASKWIDIAVVNQLKTPFISETYQPNTLSPGDPILIPIADLSMPIATVTTGAVLGQQQVEDRFGIDVRLEQLSNGKQTWAIDVGHGSEDFLVISGLDNLVQGLGKRLRWELGTVPASPDVGLPRLVGENEFSDAYSEAMYTIRNQIESDPRIKGVVSESFELTLDVLKIIIRAVPIGYDTARTMAIQMT